jgi:hypothetical protein
MDVLLNRRRCVLRDLEFMGWNNTFAMVMILREETICMYYNEYTYHNLDIRKHRRLCYMKSYYIT